MLIFYIIQLNTGFLVDAFEVSPPSVEGGGCVADGGSVNYASSTSYSLTQVSSSLPSKYTFIISVLAVGKFLPI